MTFYNGPYTETAVDRCEWTTIPAELAVRCIQLVRHLHGRCGVTSAHQPQILCTAPEHYLCAESSPQVVCPD